MTSHMILFRATLSKPVAPQRHNIWNVRSKVKARGQAIAKSTNKPAEIK